MAAKKAQIRGTGDNTTRMMMGQIRRIFDPTWLQMFDHDGSISFTVQFRHDDHARDELVRFCEMYGYTLMSEKKNVWHRYRFRR